MLYISEKSSQYRPGYIKNQSENTKSFGLGTEEVSRILGWLV